MISTIFILFLTWRLHAAQSFSTPLSNDIKIVGLPGGQIQSLPGMYVQTFRRWIVQDSTKTSNEEGQCGIKIEPIAGAGLHDLPYNEGWVNPTSVNELWWPRDIPTLQTRPLLNVLFKSGVLSYVSMGLDVRVPFADESEEGNVVSWRNYGLKSQPIARQWTTLEIAMEKLFHVEGFLLRNDDNEEKQQQQHETIFPSLNVEAVLGQVANFIAEIDPLSPIAEGFHIVSFPMESTWTDLPIPKEVEEGEDGKAFKLVCMATSEPFVGKLLDLDEGILEMSSTSVLEVMVRRTEEGGKSHYLPEPYKKLYLKT
jgi:hypothetical protein